MCSSDLKKEGFALWVWILPGLFLLGGLGAVAVTVGKGSAPAGPARDPALDAYLKKVRNETGDSQ